MLDITIKPFSVKRAVGHKPPGALRIDDFEKFVTLNDKTLLALYNGYTRGLEVQRFSEREILVEKTWKLVKEDVLNLSTATPEEIMAQETKAKEEGTAGAKNGKVKKEKTTKPARKPGEETPVVAKIVRMLQRKTGATKAQLQEALPDTKAGYINALLSRIFKEKGYTLRSEEIKDSRARTYFIDAVPTAPTE